jgi:23S rRNA pseudouridine2605 synthase
MPSDDDAAGTPAGERLQKFLARAGVASRRHAEDLIAAGAVSVNGAVVTAPGARVVPGRDTVSVNGRAIAPLAATTTVAVHKPAGYVSTARDPQGRPIVADLLPAALRAQRLVPVGRLDIDSEGLILLSNDGELALRITHPRFGAEKEYEVLVAGDIDDEALERLRRGVVLPGDDARPTAPARVRRLARPAPAGKAWLAVTLREGRKRQVRLMLAVVSVQVERLVRVRIGGLRLHDVTPQPGDWHVLTPDEIERALGKPDRSASRT